MAIAYWEYRKKVRTKMKRKLIYKSRYVFDYEQEEDGYISVIEICHKNTGYKGIQISCYQKDINQDGFNNAVGLRRGDLLRLPFMILHFKLFRLFHRK